MARPQSGTYSQLDISGGVQAGVSHLLRKRNEVAEADNADFNDRIGSASRRLGYEKVATTIEQGNDSLWGGVYKFGANYKLFDGINNAANTASTLRVLDTGGYWTTVLTSTVNMRFQCLNFFEEYYVAGAIDNQYQTLTNIDSTLVPSTSRNVYQAPACKFIADFNGGLWAMNCQINGVTYKNRIYPSSPAIGPITYVQTDHKGIIWQIRVDSTTFLKVGMQIDIWGKGTENKKVAGLTVISVDKKNKRFSFSPTNVDITDNDEIWLTGRKNKLGVLWNTDDPSPQEAEYYDLSAGREADPEITGWAKNNNRLFIYTKNSFYRHDGANLIQISDTVGCASHETIQNIGSWTIWLHGTGGVWGYNDNTGQLKLLSRAMKPKIERINQANLAKTSAIAVGRVYKLAIGELLPDSSVTTSTSTSSTSTSSTSSSTSSTSTSSTSTSSTSTSVTFTTTSTSSTSRSTTSSSISTSSTSTSSTSVSSSTSTSSTTTTTVVSTKKVVRLCYDFDMNAWWTETHKREIRFQFNHTMNGYTKPYFTDDTGRMFRDETGNLDNDDTIPMVIEFGRSNFGTDQRKRYQALLVDSDNAQGATLKYSLDGGPFKTFDQLITEDVTKIIFPQGEQLAEGRDINYKFSHNGIGEAVSVNGIVTFYDVSEAIVTETP